MSAVSVEQVREVGELIGYGLRRARPTDKSHYRTLLDRYGTDLLFRSVVDAAAEGLGLVVLATTRAGLVLAPTADSVFSIRMVDMRATALDADDKLIAGLALLGIAAYAYPNEVDLDDPDARTVDIKAVDAFIRAAAGNLPTVQVSDDQSGVLTTARRAADAYLDRPDYTPTSRGGGYKRGCTYRALAEVLVWLETQGLARPQPALGDTVFQLTDRFRVLVGDEASHTAFQRLAEVRRNDTARKVG
jgi:hypothetical protein